MQQSIQSYSDHVSMVENSMSTFASSITTKGWKIRGETPSDGNCCFHAVNDQLQTLQPPRLISHVDLRKDVVQYMEELPQSRKTYLASFLTQPFTTYLHEMGKDGTYADHVCMQSLCSTLQVDILVIHANEDVRLTASGPSARESITLGYIPELQHYVSLEKVQPIRFEVEDFVAVRLSLRRTKKMFIAKVVEVDNDLRVRFMKPTSSLNVYTWPSSDDIAWHPISDIIQKLTCPDLIPGRGIKLKFTAQELQQCKSKL